MIRDTRLLLWCTLLPTVLVLCLGIVGTVASIAVDRELDPKGLGVSTVGTYAVWWIGSCLVTCLVITSACLMLRRIERQARLRRALGAGVIGAVSPLAALLLAGAWVNAFPAPAPSGIHFLCVLTPPLVFLAPAVLGLVAPGVFLQLLRRTSSARA